MLGESSGVRYCIQTGTPLKLGCDEKTHTILSEGSTPIDTALLESLTTMDLDILNVGNTPTLRNAIKAEVLDLTLCSTRITSIWIRPLMGRASHLTDNSGKGSDRYQSVYHRGSHGY